MSMHAYYVYNTVYTLCILYVWVTIMRLVGGGHLLKTQQSGDVNGHVSEFEACRTE